MAEPTTVEVQLSPEELALLHADMAAGGYRTASELIQNALWEWHLHHGLSEEQTRRLNAAVAEGEASGIAEPFTFGELRAEAKALMQLRRQPKSA